MSEHAYDALAEVYDWLVPDELLTPAASVALFAPTVVDLLEPDARVLDCAAGTGQLAVGLALRGFDVVATDASPGMIARTRQLARDHGAELEARTCAWEDLPEQGWDDRFDAVFCVGNSLTHAAGRAARRAALAAMGGVLRADRTLVVTSRNWELVRRTGSGLQVADKLVERDGGRGLPIYAWTIPEALREPHVFAVAVALIAADGAVTTHCERLRFWPFTHDELDEDLRAAGLSPASTTYASDAMRYVVTATSRPEPGLDRS
jgi:SAM-dependent methyltransferase